MHIPQNISRTRKKKKMKAFLYTDLATSSLNAFIRASINVLYNTMTIIMSKSHISIPGTLTTSRSVSSTPSKLTLVFSPVITGVSDDTIVIATINGRNGPSSSRGL